MQVNKIKFRPWVSFPLRLFGTDVDFAAGSRRELARFRAVLASSSPLHPGFPSPLPLLTLAPSAPPSLGFQLPPPPSFILPPLFGRPPSSMPELSRRALSLVSYFALTWPAVIPLDSYHLLAGSVWVRDRSTPSTAESTPCTHWPPLTYHPSSAAGPNQPLAHHPRPTPFPVSTSKKSEPRRRPLEPRRHSLRRSSDRFPSHSGLFCKGRPWLRRGRPPRRAGFGWRGRP